MNRELAASVIDAAFESELAEDAVYTPPSAGVPVALRVVFASPDIAVGIEADPEVIQATTTIEVRASQLATPQVNGAFALNARSYRIREAPVAKDDHRLVWVCRCQAL